MKNSLLSLFAVLFGCFTPGTVNAGTVAHFSDPVFGFSVDVPTIGDPTDSPVIQRLIFMGPTVDGFSPNCNVQIQFTEMGIEAYMVLTRKQFSAAGFTILDETKPTNGNLPSISLEYTGTTSGRDLHFLAKVIAGADRVWLATCTALADSFATHRDSFAQVVGSLSVIHEPLRNGDDAAPDPSVRQTTPQ